MLSTKIRDETEGDIGPVRIEEESAAEEAYGLYDRVLTGERWVEAVLREAKEGACEEPKLATLFGLLANSTALGLGDGK